MLGLPLLRMKHSLWHRFLHRFARPSEFRFFSCTSIIAPGRQERLIQGVGGLEEERSYLQKLTRALLEKLEERYLGAVFFV